MSAFDHALTLEKGRIPQSSRGAAQRTCHWDTQPPGHAYTRRPGHGHHSGTKGSPGRYSDIRLNRKENVKNGEGKLGTWLGRLHVDINGYQRTRVGGLLGTAVEEEFSDRQWERVFPSKS